jgi:3'(2'), 5'-bisphosphate nucleotidase
MKYTHELKIAKQLALTAADEIMKIYNSTINVEYKEDKSPVTQADLLANRIINEGLQKYFPNDGILSEELATISGNRIWYVDPIDGTRGFVKRNGEFAIHIGLCEGTRPVLGVVYRPTTEDMYFGGKYIGAYRESNGIAHVLNVSRNKDVIRAVDRDSFIGDSPRSKLLQKIGVTKTIYTGSGGLRTLKVAEDLADLYIIGTPDRQNKCGTWDLCAPEAILEGAGGVIMFEGDKLLEYVAQRKVPGCYVAARDKDLAKKALDYIVN